MGPTASGKTGLAIQIAKHFHTEIISFDSRQFYKEMSIGTAVPSSEELKEVKHHFIQHLSLDTDYNAGQFAKDAERKLKHLFESHDYVVLVGGSGLYIDALLYGFDSPEVDEKIRQQIQRKLESQGLEHLQHELFEKDPETHQKIDLNNPVRVTRALEIIYITGEKLPATHARQRKKRDLFFEPFLVAPQWERSDLYDRINKRVDHMLESGLEEEAKKLHPKKHLKNLQTVGYQEFFEFFDGKIDREEAIRLIKRNTRRYAKRQLTWLRKEQDLNFLSPPFFQSFLKLVDQ